MSNTIADALKPYFYANEAIEALHNVLGLAGRVHRGYDAERRSFGLGDTIKIPIPSTFTTGALGTGTAQALNTGEVEIKLTTGREVPFNVTDKELAWSGRQLIDMHIMPAAYALANYIDQQLVALAKDVPWFYDQAAAAMTYDDFLAVRRVLRENAGAIIEAGDNHFAVDAKAEAALLGMDAFKNVAASGQSDSLIRGSLGMRAGIQPFVNSNLPTHISGTVVSAGTDNVGALSADAAKGATSIAIDSLSGTETLKKGDTFIIAGNTQRYVVAADKALASGAATIEIFPPLVQAHDDNDVVTFEDGSGTAIHADKYATNLLFNRGWAALAFAPLPEIGNGRGVDMATVTDPFTGISLRSRIAYVNSSASVTVTLDVLFGVKTLDPNKAVVYRRDVA